MRTSRAAIDTAYAQESANRELAQFSPSMAAVFAQRDANKTIRNVESGENTAGSAGKLSESLDKWEKSLQPLENAFDNFKNNELAAIVESMTQMLELWQAISPPLLLFLNVKPDKNVQAELFGDFLDKVYAEQNGKYAAATGKINAANSAHNRAKPNALR